MLGPVNYVFDSLALRVPFWPVAQNKKGRARWGATFLKLCFAAV